ncbi:MAG TPA: isocitrate lyase/phosphoenolpyruvate mutase family protein [Actinomycetota bacterium]|nr:isocitrate lyase/phosphoenolpyruvate mutase family protein [Actinomycetota bacterium]
MTSTTARQRRHAARFRELHADSALVLPNAWDAASAALVVDAGARAVATTSGGMSWSLGAADGENLDVADVAAGVARIVRSVDVPVSVDVEGGYGPSPDAVAQTVEDVVDAGAVGINLEDASPASGRALLRPDEQASRIASARETATRLGLDVWINARTDVFLGAAGDVSASVDDALARGATYADAGADSLFVPGVVDPEAVAALADGVLPLNVMAGPGAPSVAELAALGVARVSVGTALAEAAYAVVAAAARELLEAGTYGRLEGGLGYHTLNALLAPRAGDA